MTYKILIFGQKLWEEENLSIWGKFCKKSSIFFKNKGYTSAGIVLKKNKTRKNEIFRENKN
jgi:hypothetical protein